MDATEAIAEFICEQVGVSESELIDVQAAELVEHLQSHGFVIAYQSLCWCEGMNHGTTHSPGCPEADREARR